MSVVRSPGAPSRACDHPGGRAMRIGEDMEPRLSWKAITLELRNPFRVSYGASETRQAYWLRLEEDSGWGEGTIPPYYGVTAESMIACWEEAAARSEPFPNDPAGIAAWVGQEGTAPARSALDLALHDRIGRNRGLPLYRLLNLPRPAAAPTAVTVSIDEPEAMAVQAAQLAAYPIIKVKLGSEDDIGRLRAVRAARPDARLFVDANAGWAPEEALRLLRELSPLSLELVEQPVPKDDFEGMGYVQAHCDVPVVADESVRSLADVERLAREGVQGVNLKLMKVGGLGPAVEMLLRARRLGLRIMLGCMIETSIGVTAMAHLAGLADWLDLDAPLLVTNDPFEGLRYGERGAIHLPELPGIGITSRAQ
jgi:L-alanine-DL-glutamate epimerase-like enolase superfamily enzyme